MQRRFAILSALSVLVLTGCGSQSTAEVPSSPVADQGSSPNASQFATAGPSPQQEQQLPRNGTPSEEFCEGVTEQLAKFPGFELLKPIAGETSDPILEGSCTYHSSQFPTRLASLHAMRAAPGSENYTRFREVCAGAKPAPANAKNIDEDWVVSRGWIGWTGGLDGAQQAMLCTDGHYYSAAIHNTPGSTPEDALNTIKIVIG